MVEELARLGLKMGCFVGTLESMRSGLWSTTTAEARVEMRHELAASLEAAERTGGRHITTVFGSTPNVAIEEQLSGLVENLTMAADLSEAAGVVLLLEQTSELRMPGMLLNRLKDAYRIAQLVGRPEVRLVFDVVHVQLSEGNVLAQLDPVWDQVELVQLADLPDRMELGSGEIDTAAIISACLGRGYRGLFELGHSVSQRGLAGERLVLERLHKIDASIGLKSST